VWALCATAGAQAEARGVDTAAPKEIITEVRDMLEEAGPKSLCRTRCRRLRLQ